MADTAVKVEFESLPLPQEDHRLAASSVVQPFFTEEDRRDGRHLVGCGFDRRDCHGDLPPALCSGGGRPTAGPQSKGPFPGGATPSGPFFFSPPPRLLGEWQKKTPAPRGQMAPR